MKSGPQSTDANILPDKGAQRSLVTETLARKLFLGINWTEIVHLFEFGEQFRQPATICLHTDNVEKMFIPVEVFIIPELALPIQTHMNKTDLKQR